jgi:Flp pilus assembly protein TadG
MVCKQIIKSPKSKKAQGLVEFALVLPILLMLIFGIIEFGRLLFTYSAIATASREAARYGATAGDTGGGTLRYQDCVGIRAAAKRMGALVGMNDSNINIEYDDGTTTVAANCPPSVEISRADRIIVTVSLNFQSITPFFTLPAIPISSTTSRTILKDIEIQGTPKPTSTPSGGGGGTTATTTQTPSSTPTDTPEHTATHTPTSTNTPTSTSTPTTISCGDYSMWDTFTFQNGPGRLYTKVFNGTNEDIAINRIVLYWDTAEIVLGDSLYLSYLEWNGNKEDDVDDYSSPSAWIGSWNVPANGEGNLKFAFNNSLDSIASEYFGIRIEFENGCFLERLANTLNTATPSQTATKTPTPTITNTPSRTPKPSSTTTPTYTPTDVPASCSFVDGGVQWPANDKKSAYWTITNATTISREITNIVITWPKETKNNMLLNYAQLDGNTIFSNPSLSPPNADLCASGCDNSNWSGRSIGGNSLSVLKLNFSRNKKVGTYTIALEFDNDSSCSFDVSFTD